MNKRLIVVPAIALMLLVLSCAAPPERAVDKVPEAPPVEDLSAKEQNELALTAYREILDMVIERRKREILPELEAAYKNLISKYPKSFLAQESYWRLISINLNDYFPPRIDVAESYYEEFVQRYSGSNMRRVLDDSMSRFYYGNKMWERLMKKSSLYVREYINTGKIKSPLFIFFYSEAKLNLGDLVEAEKGFRIVMHNFPGSTEASISRDRVEDIRGRKSGNKEQ